MNRRDFLKRVAATAGAVAVGPGVVKAVGGPPMMARKCLSTTPTLDAMYKIVHYFNARICKSAKDVAEYERSPICVSMNTWRRIRSEMVSIEVIGGIDQTYDDMRFCGHPIIAYASTPDDEITMPLQAEWPTHTPPAQQHPAIRYARFRHLR